MILPVTLFESYPGLVPSFGRGGTEGHRERKAALASRHSKIPQSCSTKEKPDFSKKKSRSALCCCHKDSHSYHLIKFKTKNQIITCHFYFLTFFFPSLTCKSGNISRDRIVSVFEMCSPLTMSFDVLWTSRNPQTTC